MGALSIRKRATKARITAAEQFSEWMNRRKRLKRVDINGSLTALEKPGVVMLCTDDIGFYAGDSKNMRERVEEAMSNPNWESLDPNSAAFVPYEGKLSSLYGLQSALVCRESPLLNCRLLSHESELPGNPK